MTTHFFNICNRTDVCNTTATPQPRIPDGRITFALRERAREQREISALNFLDIRLLNGKFLL